MKYKDLKWWNKQTYDEVTKFLSSSRACAIVNATGTAKTSIISVVVHDYAKCDSIVIIAPRDSILDQYHNDMYDLKNMPNVMFMTYQKLLILFKSGKLDEFVNVGLIVCDELHRSGAKKWTLAVKYLMNINPQAKLLGATATPKRRDQKDVDYDMVDLLFEGNHAGNFDLKKCLELGILPKPIYVASMYSLTDQFEEKRQMVNNNFDDPKVKMMLLDELREKEIDWDRSHSYDKTLKEFLPAVYKEGKVNKILIFCKSINHIAQIRKNFDPIFAEIYRGKKLVIEEYHHKTSERSFYDFRDCDEPDDVRVLYSIEKFNEGVHVPGLGAIIMLRETESEIIYYQQIGRVLSIGSDEHPLIIDFVNNFKHVKALNIWQNVLPEPTGRSGEKHGWHEHARVLEVAFYNEVRDAIELFDSITKRIEESKMYSYEGELGTIRYFASKYKKPYDVLYSKISKGMTIKEAILTTDDTVDDIMVVWQGKQMSLKELCSSLKKNLYLVKYRLDHGKTIEEAVQ